MAPTVRTRPTRALSLYVWGVILAAGATISALGVAAWNEPLTGSRPVAFWILVVFLAVGELRPLKWLRRREGGEVTVSWTFAFAILLMAAPFAAVLSLGLASLAGDLISRKPLSRTAFNAAQVSLSLAGGSAVLELLGQRTALVSATGPSITWLPSVALAATTIFLLNAGFTCVVIALHQNLPLWSTFREGAMANMSIDGMLLALSPVFVVVARYSLLLLPLVLLTVWAVYRSAQLALAQQHEATHDQLTGLPNRRLFTQQAQAAIVAAERRHHSIAVMILDLNGFKEVNDRLGHHVGDLVLQIIGERFARAARSTDIVARLGGDEFAVLARPVRGRRDAEQIARRLLDTLEEPCVALGLPVQLSASLGISLYPKHGDDFGFLMGNADVAMYASKQGTDEITTYDNTRDHRSRGRLTLLAELLAAIESGQLLLQYQPKVDMATRRLVGVEALTRWHHPQLGLVPPNEFIPVAEHTELIEPLTDFVLRAALRQCAQWRELGFDIPVAINVSARNLHDLHFPTQVGTLLEEIGTPASMLEIELTENTVMEDPVRTVSISTQLRAMGIRLSIDDFGTGYSSLATLRDLPVNAVKIDQSFVAHMATDSGNAAIVRATIELARSLDLETIAEGVEQMAVWDMLRDFGCQSAQGYLIGRPMNANSIVDFILLATPSQVPSTHVTELMQ